MFERFTDRARRVVVLAQEEATALNHDYVGTEHILIALVRETGGVAAQAMESLGVTAEAARERVRVIDGPGKPGAPGQPGGKPGHLPFTPHGRMTLQLALREAMALGHGYIGTEHILLGLVRASEGGAGEGGAGEGGAGEGRAMQVLGGLGVEPNRVRQEVIRLVSARQVQQEPQTARVIRRGKRTQVSDVRDRLGAVEWRLSVLEQRVGTAPDLGQLDRDIAEVQRDKESAIEARDFERAAVLRDREQYLLGAKAARLQEWAALPSLSDEVGRLRDLLRRHGIDPQNGAA